MDVNISRREDARPSTPPPFGHDTNVGRPTRVNTTPSNDDGSAASRRFVRNAFSNWSDEIASACSPDHIEDLIHYKGGFSDRHLASWRAVDVDAILFELFLAKVVVEDDAIGNMIDEVKDLFSFLADNWPPGSCKRPTPTRIASISNGSRVASELAWSDGAATAPENASSSPRSALKPEPAWRPAPTSSSSVPVSVRSE